MQDTAAAIVLAFVIATFGFYADTYSRDEMPTYTASWRVSE